MDGYITHSSWFFFGDTKLLTTVEQNIEHQISYKCAYILLSKERKDKR